MSTPLSSVQGLASSIQWQDLVTSIMAQEKARLLDPVTNAISAAQSGSDAWTQFQTLVKTLNTSAVALRDGAISSVLATGGTTAGGRALFQATAANGATPGDYETEVMSLARASKIGGAPVASSSTALGLSGDFFVNGKRIVVAATDTLAKIRDTINAANTGSTGSGVAASVNTTSGGVRLVLAASSTGSSGIELTDGSTEILKQLGLVDGSVTSAVAQPQSFRLSSSSTTIATVLGVSPIPAATSITVGNTTIPVDLSTDTLAAIQQRIAAAGVDANIATETFNGSSWQRLVVGEPVGAVPGDADSARVVALLGFAHPGQSSVTQVLADASPWTDGGGAATSATALSSLSVGGTALSLVAGDTIQINGMRGDGVAVTKTLTLDGTETVASLLAVLNDPSAFGATTRGATATIAADGTLTMTDGTAGGSQLSLSLSVARANGGTASLGHVGTQTIGYDRVLTAGSDAQIRIDGMIYTRSSNTISDAIPNVTLNLSAAEPGTTVGLALTRDVTAASTAAQSLVTAYNAVAAFVKTQTAAGGALPMDSTLRGALRQVSQTLQADVPNVTGTLTRGALAGLAMDKTGQLQFDQKTFTAAMQDHPDDLLALFGNANSVQTDGSIIRTTGLGGALATVSDLLSRSGDGLAAQHVTTLQIRMKTLSTRADNIQSRLDRHRETLLSQFVAMETALARLQSQGAALTSQIKSLQSSNN